MKNSDMKLLLNLALKQPVIEVPKAEVLRRLKKGGYIDSEHWDAERPGVTDKGMVICKLIAHQAGYKVFSDASQS